MMSEHDDYNDFIEDGDQLFMRRQADLEIASMMDGADDDDEDDESYTAEQLEEALAWEQWNKEHPTTTNTDYAQQAMGQAQRDAIAAQFAAMERDNLRLSDTLRERDARIAALEAALKPFAEAAHDIDVENCQADTELQVQRETYTGVIHVRIRIYDDEGNAELLEVRHLRAAADALKGKAE